MYIKWSENLVVGIAVFDEHHKKLLALLNSLMECLYGDKKSAEGVKAKIADELLDYVGYHFNEEEQAMTSTGYPDYSLHKREHDELRTIAKDIHSSLHGGKESHAKDLADFLKKWLIIHIKRKDRNYGPFLKESGYE